MLYVTALYDIRKGTPGRSTDEYLNYGRQLLEILKDKKVVVFTESSLVEKIKPLLSSSHQIIERNFEDTYFYQHRNTIELNSYNHILHNRNIEKDTVDYIIVNCNKFPMVKEAMDLYPSEDYISWIDFGIAHVAEKLHLLPELSISSKIKQLCLFPYKETIPEREYFTYIRHNLAGGMFRGPRELIRKYMEMCITKYEEILEEGWYQLEEAVMAIVARNNPEMFEFYYGEHHNIIENYDGTDGSNYLIPKAYQKYLQYGDLENALLMKMRYQNLM